jgi:hypothetical protein
LKGLAHDYDDCPVKCPINKFRTYDAYREDFCSTCPRIIRRENFKREVIRNWNRWLSDDQRFGLNFDEVLAEVFRTSSLRGSDPENINLSASILVGVFEDESDRFDKQSRPEGV